MIKVSVVSTKEIIKKSTKILSLITIVCVAVAIVKLSKIYLNNIQISSRDAISYINDEITMMDNSSVTGIADITGIKPEQLLDKELFVSDSLKKIDLVHAEDDDSIEAASSASNEYNSDSSANSNANSNDWESNENTNSGAEANEIAVNNSEIKIDDVGENLNTEVIQSKYKQTYNYEVDGVKIKNESKYNLNALNLSSTASKINSKNVIIFHTHTCESYTKTQNNNYADSGNYRTTDLGHSVARVGDVLGSYLKSYGFDVIHDKTYHDYPAYNGSYGRSLKTVSSLLKKTPNTQIIIDLHRDAMSDESYAPKVKIGDEYVSQIMFVIGTDGSGLTHDNWRRNLEFAIKVQKKGNEMYPGLFKPIILRNARYNQHLSSAATIIEFGATGNTLEECEGAAKYLANVLKNVV